LPDRGSPRQPGCNASPWGGLFSPEPSVTCRSGADGERQAIARAFAWQSSRNRASSRANPWVAPAPRGPVRHRCCVAQIQRVLRRNLLNQFPHPSQTRPLLSRISHRLSLCQCLHFTSLPSGSRPPEAGAESIPLTL